MLRVVDIDDAHHTKQRLGLARTGAACARTGVVWQNAHHPSSTRRR